MQILKLYCCTEGAHFYGIFFALYLQKKWPKAKFNAVQAWLCGTSTRKSIYLTRARFESVVNAHADRDALALGLSPLLFEELFLGLFSKAKAILSEELS